jgi:hypothetical protein
MALGENEVRLTVELTRRALVDVRGCGVGARGWSRVNAGLVGENAGERGNLQDVASNLGQSLGCLAVLRQASGRAARGRRRRAQSLTIEYMYEPRRLGGPDARLACAFGTTMFGKKDSRGVTGAGWTRKHGGNALEVLTGVTAHGFVVRGSHQDG